MKKHLTIMMVIMCLCVFACQKGEKAEPAVEDNGGTNFQKMSLEDATAQAKAQNKLIMIDFYSPT